MLHSDKITKRLWTYIDLILFVLIAFFIFSGFNRVTAQNKNTVSSNTTLDRPVQKPVMTNLLGIDVSHYQGKVDWKQVANAYHFAFIKATEGKHYQDPAFDRNIKSIADTNLAYGAYHFFEPDTEATEQASHFLETVQDYELSLPPVLDVEVAPDSNTASFQNAVGDWLKTVAKSTGCSPIIYTNKAFWNKYLQGRFNDYTIWISDYTPEASKVESIPWSFWQFSDSDRVAGISGPVDESRYRGDVATLKQLGSCKG